MDARAPTKDPRAPDTEADTATDSHTDEERWVRCADCGLNVAPVRASIAVNGAHQHEFVNPSAEVFVVRCFAEAPGCIGVGERSTAWTWFPRFAWQIELCRRCAGHLGWSFHGASRFYGLIRERLT